MERPEVELKKQRKDTRTKLQIMNKVTDFYDKVLATALGAGYWPWGPGTMGAAVGVLLWWLASLALSPQNLLIATIIAIVFVTLISVPSINRLERQWGEDPSRVVIDEVAGVWVVLLGVPHAALAGGSPVPLWGWVLSAFILFRFFDIVKPLGVRKMESLPGGWGVMADDLLAGVYGYIILLALTLFL